MIESRIYSLIPIIPNGLKAGDMFGKIIRKSDCSVLDYAVSDYCAFDNISSINPTRSGLFCEVKKMNGTLFCIKCKNNLSVIY